MAWRSLTNASDAFLSGKVVDENGLPPLTAHYTVVTEGNFKGRQGFIVVQEDRIDPDGTFVSALPPGKYFVRFFGILQNPASAPEPQISQSRFFDFVYPNAETVSEALPLQLQSGETMHSVFQVPRPRWFHVAGRVIGNLPVSHEDLYVMFQRDMGILPDVGGGGFSMSADGKLSRPAPEGIVFCICPRDGKSGTERVYDKTNTPVRLNNGED